MTSVPYSIQDVYNGEAKNRFTVVSTFAGGGGSSTGYRLAGGNILAINEFIPSAVDTYLANYPKTIIFPGDIRELTGKMILDRLKLSPGELDILDGSPPCASFSTSGKREKGWGKVKKYSDTTQRVDDLFFEFIRILKEVQPKVFVSENVKGLSIGIAKGVLGTLNRGFGLCQSETILSEFQKCGYKVRWKILNAADYGVPQTRQRLIIIGVRNDLGLTPSFPKRTVNKWVSLREAFEGVDTTNNGFPFNKKNRTEQWQMKCLPGQSVSDLHPRGSYFNFGRYNPDQPSPTLLQATAGKYHVHYSEDRYPNIIEGKRIQGFPDDYILLGDLHQQWERLGRSVPPLMMEAIAKHIYRHILREI